MDPLSVTLAVLTLATAVKDLVELAQKIHESFARVSKNLRNAQRVAENVKEMVDEIKTFCEDHKDVLASMKDFGLALQGLLANFRSFEASILPLLPKISRGKLGPFIRGWWSNNKIHESLSDLESDVMKVMRGYMMKHAMRTEVKLETIHQETSRGLTGITRGLEVLEVVRRDVSALCTATAATMAHYSYESRETTSDEFDRNVIMFAQSTLSTSSPMLRTPNVITEELMTAAYIKLQINSIAAIVEKISVRPTSAITDVASFQMVPTLEPASMSVTHLRHHVVRQVTTIRDLLNTPGIHTVSIEGGATALCMLSTALATLGMDQEAILLGHWGVTLIGALVGASRGGHQRAYLALYLCDQSIRYQSNGDKLQSLRSIEEAFTIAQDLRNQYGEKTHIQMLHSKVLLQYARLVDNQQSIQLVIKAIQVLEAIFNVQAFTLANGKIQSVVQPTSSFFDRLFSSNPPINAVINYAVGLLNLGIYIDRTNQGFHQSVLALVHLAVALRRNIMAIHGHIHKAGLADTLSVLVQSGPAGHIPRDELLDITNECIQLLRELAEHNHPHYARKLVSALWVKASTLHNLGQDTESIATWEEAASLAKQIVQDSALCARILGNLSIQFRRLKRHDDAVRTGMLAVTTYHEKDEIRAGGYSYLSRDLLLLRRYKESAQAARTSVMLYRHLAMRDPGKWMADVTEGLSHLAHCLAAMGDNSQALLAWTESLSILDNFLDSHSNASSDVISRYCAALNIHQQLSFILKDKEECLKICPTVIQYLRQLLEIYPQNKDLTQCLLRTEFLYAYNMNHVGNLQDAHQYIDCQLNIRTTMLDGDSSILTFFLY